MPPPAKTPIRAVRAALVWFRKTTALDGKAGIGAGAAIDPVCAETRHSDAGRLRPNRTFCAHSLQVAVLGARNPERAAEAVSKR